MQNYKSQAEAEAALERALGLFKNDLPYCPLIKNWCREDCVTFWRGRVQRLSDTQFQVAPPQCINVMFFGES